MVDVRVREKKMQDVVGTVLRRNNDREREKERERGFVALLTLLCCCRTAMSSDIQYRQKNCKKRVGLA